MKNLLIALFYAACFMAGWLIADYAKADSCQTDSKTFQTQETFQDETPKELKGYTLIARSPSGQEHTFSIETHKIVKREGLRVVTNVVEAKYCHSDKPNRLSVLLGHGRKDSLDRQVSESQVDVSNTQGAVLGVQYQRSLTDTFNLGIQFQDNKTGSAMLGIDF